MKEFYPTNTAELAGALREASQARQKIILGGAFSKNNMGGPVADADVRLSLSRMRRVLQYEPKDLTISVEAGLPYAELAELLAGNGQMLPLDPPLAERATIGGVIAANCSGPRRRLYGAARDVVIGMNYVTLDGHEAQSGGMVVKNVAGLDVQKTLIGSFGTLAAIGAVNFKLAPKPETTRTFVLSFANASEAVAARDGVLKGQMQPAAMEVVNEAAAKLFGLEGACLVLRVGGSETLLARYSRELDGALTLEGEREAELWRGVEGFTAAQRFVVRVGHPLTALRDVLATAPGTCVSRAGNGVSYLGFDSAEQVNAWMQATARSMWARVVEWAPVEEKRALEQWPEPGPALPLMQRMKDLFDPHQLLNCGRLYGRL